MAVETRATSDELVTWNLSKRFDEDTRSTCDLVVVGEHEFEKAEFYIGIVEFLGGEKEIRAGNINIGIPDEPSGNVQFGDLELTYAEYLSGVMWALQNTGVFYQEFQVPLALAQAIALESLHKQLSTQVPERNQQVLEHARELRVSNGKLGGIHGLRPGDFLAY